MDPIVLSVVDVSRRPVLLELLALERAELAELGGLTPGPDGSYEVPGLDRYLTEPDRAAYLILRGGSVVGCALVRPFDDGSSFVHAFYVRPEHRRHGVGRTAAVELLRKRAGRWTIAFLEENGGASPFWRGVATELAGDSWTEERQSHDGRTFTMLRLAT